MNALIMIALSTTLSRDQRLVARLAWLTALSVTRWVWSTAQAVLRWVSKNQSVNQTQRLTDRL